MTTKNVDDKAGGVVLQRLVSRTAEYVAAEWEKAGITEGAAMMRAYSRSGIGRAALLGYVFVFLPYVAWRLFC